MKKTIFTISILLLFFYSAYSQRGVGQNNEKIKTEKIAYLTERLELTDIESEKFWPLYFEYEKIKYQIRNKRKTLTRKFMKEAKKKKITTTKGERMKIIYNNKSNIIMADKLIDEVTRLQREEFENEMKYDKKLREVLTSTKIILLYKLERNFRRHLLKKCKINN